MKWNSAKPPDTSTITFLIGVRFLDVFSQTESPPNLASALTRERERRSFGSELRNSKPETPKKNRRNHGVLENGQNRSHRLAHLPRMHELRRQEMARLGSHDGRGARSFRDRGGVGDQLLRYRRRLLDWRERGGHRAMARRDGQAPRDRCRDQGARPDGVGPQPRRIE